MHNLRVMDQAGYTNLVDGGNRLVSDYDGAERMLSEMLESGDGSRMPDYRRFRDDLFARIGSFLNGGAREELVSQINTLLESPDLDEATREEYLAIRDEATQFFDASRRIHGDFMETREILDDNLPGTFVLIGHTGTSTTDRGVNPFSEVYDNVGTHASILNTILQQDFLDTLPQWVGLAIAAGLCLLVWLVLRNLGAGWSVGVGLAAIVLTFGGSLLYFIISGTYIPTLLPLAGVFITFVALTIIKFFGTAQERTYIRNAFGHYLSEDVINELMDDPDKLALGGQKRNITAMFTDIAGFSSISEPLDPEDLVHLLNDYLTTMSDTILDLNGTIDKYEGDAIIAFFGAPLTLPDHARRACLAAVRMKKAEEALNDRLLNEERLAIPLRTRMGVNTGEIVVGNMGTNRKMNYTMMGNDVNIAARLEGVNKIYKSSILVTQGTREAAGNELIFRKLNQVRVVGIDQPIRLYEVIDEKSVAKRSVTETVETFHEALDLFENRQWTRAEKLFKEVKEMNNGVDGPSDKFLSWCEEYAAKAPPENKFPVYNMTSK
jgi:adenylate cyclase